MAVSERYLSSCMCRNRWEGGDEPRKCPRQGDNATWMPVVIAVQKVSACAQEKCSRKSDLVSVIWVNFFS